MSSERTDLIQTLRKHRGFLRFTVRDLTDEQAALRPTASALSLGGLIKHVAEIETQWMRFAVGGAEGMMSVRLDWENGHRMLPGETLEGLLVRYDGAGHADIIRETIDGQKTMG